jgi:phage terminase large subunit
MEKQIIYKPRTWTKIFHDGPERWKVLVIHRRAGKTYASINHLIRDCLRTPNSRFAYIAPTYRQAKDIAWDMLKKSCEDIDGIRFFESELRADFKNGARIKLYGADNPDSLRGLALWGVIFDEYSQQPGNIFTEIIRPALADNKGYAIWIGTPKGKNDFFRLYEYAKRSENWLGLLLTVDDTKLIEEAELADAEGIMDSDEFKQEWFCSFEAAIKGAYYASQVSKARKDDRITSVPYIESLRVDTWWDLGIGDSTAIWFTQYVGNEIHFIDYYEASGEGLKHYASILDKRGYLYNTHNAPHDIEVRELGSGKSRIEMAKKYGIKFKVVPKLGIQDGINAVRTDFNRYWFDENKCARGLDAIAQYHKEWDEKRGEFMSNPRHDWTSHASDALRYCAVGCKKIIGFNDDSNDITALIDKYSVI